MSDAKVAVLGTGANGAGISADLVAAGIDVTLIDQWPANVEAMRARGVLVVTPEGSMRTPVRAMHLCDVATLRERFDVVLLVTKAYDTRWACELIEPLLSPDGFMAGLQNGMTVDAMAAVIGRERTIGCVIEIAAAMFEPGVVERHTPPSGTWFALGPASPAARSGGDEEVASLLRHAGAVQLTSDIRSAKWMKLVVNAAELVPSAILGLPLLEAARTPGMHEFMLRAGKEAVHTAVATGHAVVPIFGLEDVDGDAPDRFVERMLDAVYTQWSLPETRTTVLQDWMKGRRSEADQLNGFVASESARIGRPTPANDRIVEIAHRIEAGSLQPRVENAAILLADA